MSEPSQTGPRHGRLPADRVAARPSARRAPRSSTPRGAGAAPRRTGSIPRTTGSIPRSTGSIPMAQGQSTGAVPRGTGVSPRTTGATPRTTGAMPRNAGAAQQPTGAIPQGTGSIPSGTGSIPQGVGTISQGTGAIPRTTGMHRRPAQLEPQPARHPFAITAVLIVALAIIAGALFFITCCILVPDEPAEPSVVPGRQVQVVIPQGAGGDVIVNALSEAGVISDGNAFMQAVTSLGADQKLQPGTYLLTTGMDPEAVVRQLMAGPNTSTGRLTVPEGLTVARTAEVVEASLGIPADEFLEQAKASLYVEDYPFLSMAADDSLEGFLWAKTYDFSGREISADAVIRAMLDQYESEIPTIDFAAGEAKIESAYGVKMSDYDILILASIIEREATKAEDMPLISSVFYNRMRDGMRLQSDATMGYVTEGEPTPEDLETDNPYNTYTRDGLPPTPICTPDLACIEAALDPAESGYLYFLIIEREGYSNHTFSQTYEEHLAAIEKAREDQAALG